MPVSVRIETEVPSEVLFWKALPAQSQVAAQATLTRLARMSQAHQKQEMPRDLDRPNPYTRNSMVWYAAKRNKLESGVFVKRDQAEYLSRLVNTGIAIRRPLRSMIFVPSDAERTNQYGNIGRARRRSALQSPNTFVRDRGRYKIVLQRQGRRTRFVGTMVRQTKYAGQYWKFYDRAREHADQVLPGIWISEFDKTIGKSRATRVR